MPGLLRLNRIARLTVSIAVACLLATTAIAAEGHRAMVAAESDRAAAIGLGVLERGGNAIDAAIAISLALGVTNSASCGIGGGGFMLIYWKREEKYYDLDYREVGSQ